MNDYRYADNITVREAVRHRVASEILTEIYQKTKIIRLESATRNFPNRPICVVLIRTAHLAIWLSETGWDTIIFPGKQFLQGIMNLCLCFYATTKH